MDPQSSRSALTPGRLACRILLAEDDRDHQPLLALMLRKANAEVTVAENGQVAIDLALAAREAERPFDMIVMDMQMPVLDGYGATEKLRAAGFDIPIIALTARSVSTDRKKSLAAGCDDFLAKPLSRNELVRRLAGHLERFRAKISGQSEQKSEQN